MSIKLTGSGGPVVVPQSEPTNTGALAYWSCNSTVADSKTGGAGYDITTSTPLYIPFKLSNAGSLAALYSIGKQPGVTSLNAALKLTAGTTICGFVNVLETPLADTQIWSAMVTGDANTGNCFWGIKVDVSRIPRAYWESGAGVDNAAAGAALTLGQWYHLAMTRDAGSTRCRLYRNGVLETETGSLTAHTSGTSVTTICLAHNAAGTATNMAHFGWALYNSEKTADDILAIYNSAIGT
jgi:hypothetical protein